MKIFSCLICNSKNVKFPSFKNSLEKVLNSINNMEKHNLEIFLKDQDANIIEIHKCNRCYQRTIVFKNFKTGVIEKIWLEYVINSKLIEGDINLINNKINTLEQLLKKNDILEKKIQLLIQEKEIYKLKLSNLEHTMKASISIKLHSAI